MSRAVEQPPDLRSAIREEDPDDPAEIDGIGHPLLQLRESVGQARDPNGPAVYPSP